jgi:hypothetical protein
MTASFDSSAQGPFANGPFAEGRASADDGLLGRSVMKWGEDGELSALDLQQILARLSSADAQAAGMMTCPVDLP